MTSNTRVLARCTLFQVTDKTESFVEKISEVVYWEQTTGSFWNTACFSTRDRSHNPSQNINGLEIYFEKYFSARGKKTMDCVPFQWKPFSIKKIYHSDMKRNRLSWKRILHWRTSFEMKSLVTFSWLERRISGAFVKNTTVHEHLIDGNGLIIIRVR